MKPSNEEPDISSTSPIPPNTAAANGIPATVPDELHTSEEILRMLKLLTMDMTARKAEKRELQKKFFERTRDLERLNLELQFQNGEKEKRAAELAIANAELSFQNAEKEKRAAELVIANTELAFQNSEKENRAAELVVANTELVFQAEEKEKRAAELIAAHEELHVFTYISSHDLQEPLRKIQLFAALLLETEKQTMSAKVASYLKKMTASARQMQILIEALQVYSDVDMKEEQVFEKTSLGEILLDVKKQFSEAILEKNITIDAARLGNAHVNPYQFRQVFSHLVDNAVKFSNPDVTSYLTIRSSIASGRELEEENPAMEEGKLSPEKNYCHIRFSDNGIGFDMEYRHKIFEIFQRLHNKGAYGGAGIGLSIIKKIIQNHAGFITATGEADKGAIFDIYIPDEEPIPLHDASVTA
jgi:light-regulated signal transduction histidine kinase (bacteriophytochrome)